MLSKTFELQYVMIDIPVYDNVIVNYENNNANPVIAELWKTTMIRQLIS